MQKIISALILVLTAKLTVAQYTVNGSATQDACNLYTLTPEAGGKSGSVWNNNKINLTQSFDFNFDVFLGYNNSPGADGIAFVLQPISTSVGSSGGGLGYQGITPAVGVTLDTYQNAGDNDPAFDHIAIQLNGDLSHNTANNIAGPAQIVTSTNIEDGQWHSLRLIWNAATTTLTAYVDGINRVSAVKDFVTDVFGGNPMVFWGFTGSTGGEFNLQRFKTALNPAYNFMPGQKRCVNEPITFKDSTISFTNIVKFYLDFGDGSPIDSVNLNPIHTYANGGDYTVKQRVIGADGCEATNTQVVRIGTKPVINFTSSGGNCAPTGSGPSYPSTQFNDASIILVGSPAYYYWDFGGGQVFSGPLTNITFNYATPGDKPVRHMLRSAEGCESDTLDKYVHIYGRPTVDFLFNDSVCLGSQTSFLGTINPALGDTASIFEWNWTFTNPLNQINTVLNPTHTFQTSGGSNVTFVARPIYAFGFNTCLGVAIKNVFVVDKPIANFKYATICQSSQTLFTDSSYTSDNIPINQWWWQLNGGITGTQNTIAATYNNPGTDIVKLVVHNSKGCASDTLKKVITINAKPIAKFGVGTTICTGLPVSFTDSSTGGTVSSWSWVYNYAQWSTQQNTTKTFASGNQTTGLVATNAAGCKSDTAFKTFYVNPLPNVSFNFKDACKFAPVSFTAADNSGTVTQWKWNFGDGETASTQNALHTYNANGTYKVKLYATTANGCYSDTLQKDINIYGTNAFAGNDTIAAGGQPVILHASGGLSYTWGPANLLNDATSATPVAILNNTQTFTLKAFTPEGCESYDDVTVKIYKGPDIYLPNAFTPNGDNLNDVYRGIPVGLQEFNYLKIYNRWGQLVFYATDYRKGWDGTWQSQKQPGGAYIVMAKGKDYKGNIIDKKATVMLIR